MHSLERHKCGADVWSLVGRSSGDGERVIVHPGGRTFAAIDQCFELEKLGLGKLCGLWVSADRLRACVASCIDRRNDRSCSANIFAKLTRCWIQYLDAQVDPHE